MNEWVVNQQSPLHDFFGENKNIPNFFLVLSRSRPRWPQRLAAATRVGHRPVPGAATEPQHCRILGLENARIVLWSKILIKNLGDEMDGSTDEISRTAH